MNPVFLSPRTLALPFIFLAGMGAAAIGAVIDSGGTWQWGICAAIEVPVIFVSTALLLKPNPAFGRSARPAPRPGVRLIGGALQDQVRHSLIRAAVVAGVLCAAGIALAVTQQSWPLALSVPFFLWLVWYGVRIDLMPHTAEYIERAARTNRVDVEHALEDARVRGDRSVETALTDALARYELASNAVAEFRADTEALPAYRPLRGVLRYRLSRQAHQMLVANRDIMRIVHSSNRSARQPSV